MSLEAFVVNNVADYMINRLHDYMISDIDF